MPLVDEAGTPLNARPAPASRAWKWVAAVCVAINFALITAGIVHFMQWSPVMADLLYAADMVRDVRLHLPLDHWTLPPPTFVFPDVVLSLALLCAVRDSLLFYYAGFTVATFCIAWLALVSIGRSTNSPDRHPFWTLSLLTLPCSVYASLFSPEVGLHLYMPFNHVGALCNGLMVLALALTVLRRGWSPVRFLLLGLLAGVALASDPLFLPQFLFPLCVAAAACLVGRMIRVSDFAWFIAASLAAPAIALVCQNALLHAGFIIPPLGPVTLHLADFYAQFQLASAAFTGVVKRNWPVAILVAAWALFTAGSIARLLHFVSVRRARPSEAEGHGLGRARTFLHVFAVVGVITSLLVPILTGQAQADHLRYFLPVYMMPLFVLMLRAMPVLSRERAALFCNGAGVALTLAAFATTRYPWFAPLRMQSDDAVAIINTANARRLRFGYDFYWNAKPVTYLSDRRVCVSQISETFLPYVWIANPNWIGNPDGRRGSDHYPPYAFVMASPDLPREKIVARFGEPAGEDRRGDLDMLVYDRPADVAFRNALRSPAAMHLGRRVMAGRLTPPAVEDYRITIDAAAVPVPPAGLNIKITPPARGNVVELTIDAGHVYHVDCFDAAGGNIAEADSRPMPGGNRDSRFILLPENLPPVAGVRIVPTSGDGPALLGYFSLYPDARD